MGRVERPANVRGCYCAEGQTTCGVCERCGAPGHLRHFPGAVPYTGAWCDRCYRIVGWTHLAKNVTPVLGLAIVLLVLWRACAAL